MFNYTFLGIILLGTFSKSFSSIFTCSEGWDLHGSKCYKLDPEPRNFINSKKFCENLNAEMIMPITAEENSVLSEIGEWFWIGLIDHDKTTALDWTWNDGSKLESNDRWSNDLMDIQDENKFTLRNLYIRHSQMKSHFSKGIIAGHEKCRDDHICILPVNAIVWGLNDVMLGEPNNDESPEECVISCPNGWADVPCTGIKTTACQRKPDIIADEDESVTLTCDVKYKEKITKLFWTRSTDDTSVIVSEYTKGGNVILPNLVFEHVKWTDEGLYKCHVIFISGLTLIVETSLFINATNMFPCSCEYRRKLEYWGFKIIPNRTREELLQELESELQKIKKELKVNKRQLSSSIRKRTSATDRRKSSETMGLAGTAVICIVVGLVILIDLLSLVKFVKSTITFWNSKKIRQKAKDKKSKMRKKFDINKKIIQTSESFA